MTPDMFDTEVEHYGSATFPAPRPFQDVAHQALRAGRRDGHKNQMLMAPTGGGKTFLALRVAHEALKKGKRAIFVCDRTTLIDQTSRTADRYGLSAHSVLQANHWRYDARSMFQIASAQTLARRQWPEADVIIIDEAHTQMKVWTEHIMQTNASVVGLSATPFSAGLGKLFSNLVNAATMHDLTQSGVLVPMVPLVCKAADMTGAETSGGEWTDRAAESRGMAIIGDVVSEWIKHGQGRKTIVFGSTIKHCEELCRQFSEVGVMAALFTSETSPGEREALLGEFRKPDSSLRVLISVEALAKGFDVPDVGCVVDCRPLRKSLSTAIQMWGRGLRSSPETGKQNCILLDHSGNIVRFADDFSNVYFNGLEALDSGEKLDKAIRRDPEEKKGKPCPSCGFTPCGKRCIACGFERKSSSNVESLPGEMVAFVLGGKKLADDKRHLYEQCCTYARAHSKPETQSGRAAHLFRDMTGSWPLREWKFDATPSVPLSRNTLNKIRSMNIAHAKGRRVV